MFYVQYKLCNYKLVEIYFTWYKYSNIDKKYCIIPSIKLMNFNNLKN